jgi:hypothetical protein
VVAADATDDTKIGLTIPQWIPKLVEHGPWTVLAFVLIWRSLFQQDQSAAIATAVVNNGISIAKLDTRMTEAAKMMHEFSLDLSKSLDNQLLISLEMCVVQAEGLKIPGGTQRCFDAAHGKLNEHPPTR